ncbi:MAG: COX15/CtaA family protein [Polyangiaceae bacterium]|nr:COX15/CtaA family protein [Polyangiaceae bacterium]
MSSPAPRADRAVAAWLLACAALVAAMVVVGGITRLTRSGLSIVEWRPVTGVLPPLTDAAWAAELARYQASPEHRLVTQGITLEAYKSIFWVEWAHRLLGRVTGLAILAPLAWFAWRRRLSPETRRAGVLAGVLVLVQGLAGWLMVKSGLVDVPRVSHLRLAVHLVLALSLFALLLDAALGALGVSRGGGRPPARAVAALVAVFTTVTWGAFVAGLHGGLACATFPTMHGAWVPWPLASPVSDGFTAQFAHRVLALTTLLVAIFAAVDARRAGAWQRKASRALVVAVLAQASLGALVVVSHVDVRFAGVHQATALLVLGLATALARGPDRA